MTSEITRTTYRDVMGVEPPDVLTPAEQVAFSSVWPSAGITRKERFLAALVCIAWSNDEELINAYAYGALASKDLSIEELLEWVLHFAIYCGWPKASAAESAITAAHDRLRHDRGEDVTPLPVLDPSDAHLGLPDWEDRMAAGRERFAEVNGIPAPTPDTPYRNSGIIGFVFGHLWRRPALTTRERRFITVPCVLVEGARIPMLNHVGSAMESGHLTKAEMDEVVATIAAYSGFELAHKASEFAENAWSAISAGGSWTDALRA